MIISHHYTNLLEKILKNTINSNFKIEHFDDYISLCSNLESSIFKFVRDSIVKFFEQIDLTYKNSVDRKKELYCKGKYRRTLITIFGEISFERHYYTPKDGGESFFFLDKLLSLPKYDNYDYIVKGLLMEKLASSTYAKAAKDVSELISNRDDKKINISRQEVFFIFKNFELDPPSEIFDKYISSEVLYIILDEKYIHSKDKNKDNKKTSFMAKHAVIYTGKSLVSKNRFKLDNKAVLSSVDSSYEFSKDISDFIYNNYEIDNIKHIIISGDGASWIIDVYDSISTVNLIEKTFVLDVFHTHQAINRITTDKEERNTLRNYLKINKKKSFKEFSNSILSKTPERLEKIINNTNYILNHWRKIQNAKNKLFIGCPMEAHISHDMAKRFSRDPKAYSPNYISKHLKLNDCNLNNIDIYKLYIESKAINTNEFNQLDLSIFNTYHSNIPVFESNSREFKLHMDTLCGIRY